MLNEINLPDSACFEPFDGEACDAGLPTEARSHWRTPYEMNPKGLWRLKPDPETGADKPEWIASPFVVIGQCRTAAGGEWGLLIGFRDGDGRDKRVIVSRAALLGDGVAALQNLASEGLRIGPGRTKSNALRDALGGVNPIERVRLVQSGGWTNGMSLGPFVLGMAAVGGDPGEPIHRLGDAFPLTVTGDLDGWINKVCAPSAGNSRLVMAICVAFVGPLLGVVGSEGFGLHIRGPSSCGKTTALALASSVGGYPLGTWRATGNGLEGIASAANDGLLILDELGEINANEIAPVIYMLGNGQGKARAGQSGDAKARKAWRVAILSSGEISVAQKIAETGRGSGTKAGQEVRLIDLEADAGMGLGAFETLPNDITAGAFSDALKRQAKANSGHALAPFIQALQANQGKVAIQLSNHIKTAFALAYPDLDGQAGRVRDKFALLASAGEFATQSGLTGWPQGEATNAAKVCFEAWQAPRKGASHEAHRAIDAVRGFIQTHGASRFHLRDDTAHNARVMNRAGWRQDINGVLCYCFLSEPWKSEVLAGQDVRHVHKVLAAADLLVTDKQEASGRKRYTFKLSTPDGTQNVYAVRASILADGDGVPT